MIKHRLLAAVLLLTFGFRALGDTASDFYKSGIQKEDGGDLDAAHSLIIRGRSNSNRILPLFTTIAAWSGR